MSSPDKPEDPESIGGDAELDVPPTEAEIAEAELLRLAIEKGPASGMAGRDREERAAIRADRDLVQTIRAASVSGHLSPERNQRLIERALRANSRSVAPPIHAVEAGDSRGGRGSRRPLGSREGVVALRGSKPRGAFWALGAGAGFLAMAAAVAVVVRQSRPSSALSPDREGPILAYSRSTADLFPEGIPRSGGTTSRVDRIAYARAQDLRQNQFARWGAQ